MIQLGLALLRATDVNIEDDEGHEALVAALIMREDVEWWRLVAGLLLEYLGHHGECLSCGFAQWLERVIWRGRPGIGERMTELLFQPMPITSLEKLRRIMDRRTLSLRLDQAEVRCHERDIDQTQLIALHTPE